MPTSRAADSQKKILRGQWLDALSAQATTPTDPQASLAARFGSFADTVQTRLDSTNGVGPTLTGSLQAQVDRALSQVLRQAPTSGSPTSAYGGAGGSGTAPLMAQALSVAMLNGTGGPPAIAPQQAALVQEATLVKGDLLAVLDTLQPLSTFAAAPSDLAAVTAIVRAEVEMLVEEFTRTTLRPRTQRVRVLLGGLLGWNAARLSPPYAGDLGLLLTLLNLFPPVVPTLLVEQQRAGQGVLVNDAGQLLGDWLGFRRTQLGGTGDPSPWEANLGSRDIAPVGRGGLAASTTTGRPTALGSAGPQVMSRLAMIQAGGQSAAGSYSERLIQADLLLPVVGQDAARVAGALDAIGLSQGEQEATYVDLPSLVDMDLLLDESQDPPTFPPLPLLPPSPLPARSLSVLKVTTSVTDILDWTAGLADGKTLDLVRQAGQLGLELTAAQADGLF